MALPELLILTKRTKDLYEGLSYHQTVTVSLVTIKAKHEREKMFIKMVRI